MGQRKFFLPEHPLLVGLEEIRYRWLVAWTGGLGSDGSPFVSFFISSSSFFAFSSPLLLVPFCFIHSFLFFLSLLLFSPIFVEMAKHFPDPLPSCSVTSYHPHPVSGCQGGDQEPVTSVHADTLQEAPLKSRPVPPPIAGVSRHWLIKNSCGITIYKRFNYKATGGG